MKKVKEKKIQKVFTEATRRGKVSHTRHIVDGRMRALDCYHGVTCRDCFMKTSEEEKNDSRKDCERS